MFDSQSEGMDVSFVTSIVNVRDALDKRVERSLFNEEVDDTSSKQRDSCSHVRWLQAT